jgi:hypothetical protein
MLIFIIPDDVDVLECPCPRDPELQETVLFSSMIVMERYPPKTTEESGDEECICS